MISVLLAEDHQTVREGIRLLVNGQADMKVVAEAGDGATAIERAQDTKPDVVVLDLTMPGMNGLAAAKSLHASLPSCAIVALTRHDNKAYVRELFAAGASAYVLKQSPSTELLAAIRAAVAGNRYVDPALQDFDQDEDYPKRRGPATITDREKEVLQRMAAGESNKGIAAAMDISVKTVEVHKANAMRKLNLSGRTDLVRYALLNGWLHDLSS